MARKENSKENKSGKKKCRNYMILMCEISSSIRHMNIHLPTSFLNVILSMSRRRWESCIYIHFVVWNMWMPKCFLTIIVLNKVKKVFFTINPYIYKPIAHVGKHEVLPSNALILHLAFFFLPLSLSFFTVI